MTPGQKRTVSKRNDLWGEELHRWCWTLKRCLHVCLLSAHTCTCRQQRFYKVSKSLLGVGFFPRWRWKLIGRLTRCSFFLCAVQFSSLKTETERIQAEKDQLQAELLASRTELDALRVALSHVQNTNKALTSDKVKPVFNYRVRVGCGAATEAVSLNARQPCSSRAWSCAAR